MSRSVDGLNDDSIVNLTELCILMRCCRTVIYGYKQMVMYLNSVREQRLDTVRNGCVIEH